MLVSGLVHRSPTKEPRSTRKAMSRRQSAFGAGASGDRTNNNGTKRRQPENKMSSDDSAGSGADVSSIFGPSHAEQNAEFEKKYEEHESEFGSEEDSIYLGDGAELNYEVAGTEVNRKGLYDDFDNLRHTESGLEMLRGIAASG